MGIRLISLLLLTFFIAPLLLFAFGGMVARVLYEIPPATAAPPAEADIPLPAGIYKTDEGLAAFFSRAKNMYLLDLTLPLLEEGFVDAETAAAARATAASLERYIRETEGETALAALRGLDADSKEMVRLKNAWLDAIGATEDYTPFAPLHFERSELKDADIYPFVIPGKDANWYFAAQDVMDMGYPAFLSRYLEIVPLAELDFADAREYLKDYIPKEHPPVDVCTHFFDNSGYNGDLVAGEFISYKNRIYLFTNWDEATYALLHEYIHYLRREDAITDPFSVEAITEEIGVFELENRLRRHSDFFSSKAKSLRKAGLWDEEYDCINLKNLHMYRSAAYYLGTDARPYTSIAQFRVTQRPNTMSRNYLSISESTCMAWYMISLYGKDAVMEHAMSNKLHLLMEKPFEEFYIDFSEWLLTQAEVYGWTLPAEDQQDAA